MLNMDKPKSVVFSNETPNDKGSIIPNSSLDFTRFSKNPIMLCNHEWEEVIGHWENIRLEGGDWIADPVFAATEDGKEHKILFEGNHLKCASIGAQINWKKTQTGQDYKNEKGLRVAEKTYLYEISMVAIPSNPDAVALNSIAEYTDNYEVLTSKKTKKMYKPENKQMNGENGENETPELTNVEAQHKEPDIEPDKDADDKVPDVKTEKKSKMKTVIMSAWESTWNEIEKLLDLSAKKENTENQTPVQNITINVNTPAIEPVKEAINLKSENNVITEKMEKPEIKTTDELKSQGIEKPPTTEMSAQVVGTSYTMTELRGSVEGQRILGKLKGKGGEVKDRKDHKIFLHAIKNDPKYAALHVKLNLKTADAGIENRYDFANLLGHIDSLETFTSSDDALTTPATAAIEWMSLIIDVLYPSSTWKSRIPVFPAMMTEKNLGLIWANNAADPTIHKGTKPSSPTAYEYTDTAVSLKLNAYWLNPMLWTPLTMAYLRYDQMAKGWGQALKKLFTTIDSDLIYTLAAVVPAASTLKSSGTGFTISGSSDVDSFLLNTAFTGSLAKPTLSDILKFQQLFEKQNFDLMGWAIDSVLDPTMKKYIMDDEKAKSKLTRFVGEQNEEIAAYSHTGFFERSKVALYNPATGLVVDPTGVVPAGAISAGLVFIPEQIGIGIGQFDVFSRQDPDKYGYLMSCDTRMGIAPLRANYNGLGMFTYGDPVV